VAETDRIPTWGLVMMLVASAVGVWLLGKQLATRYKKRWPW
jgi:phosphate/sulfate permease